MKIKISSQNNEVEFEVSEEISELHETIIVAASLLELNSEISNKNYSLTNGNSSYTEAIVTMTIGYDEYYLRYYLEGTKNFYFLDVGLIIHNAYMSKRYRKSSVEKLKWILKQIASDDHQNSMMMI